MTAWSITAVVKSARTGTQASRLALSGLSRRPVENGTQRLSSAAA
jgi:hypothetical protein